MIAFGPVPSRRLGQSLGINHIPPKVCSYNCVYCQVGLTAKQETDRRTFYEPQEVVQAVEQKVEQGRAAGSRIDYLTFVPDGEPTLDIHLGKIMGMLRPWQIKIAVITNASLLWRDDVREELIKADLVSLKVDAVEEATWRKINRPHEDLEMTSVLKGAEAFGKEFRGELITETMLVKGVNDDLSQVKATAAFLEKIKPAVSYLAIPTRPPSETWVLSPDEQTLTEAYQIFSQSLPRVEILAGFSEEEFQEVGDTIQHLLDITCVHPMREQEALTLLKQGGKDEADLQALLEQEMLVKVDHQGERFYVRKLPVS